MNISTQMQTAMAQVSTVMAETFLPEGARCFLLKRSGQTKALTPVAEVTSGWFVQFNEYRGQMQFRFATTTDGFADQFAQKSYIGYGVPDGSDRIDVYETDPTQNDVVPPSGNSPFWKVFAVRVPNERYTIT